VTKVFAINSDPMLA